MFGRTVVRVAGLAVLLAAALGTCAETEAVSAAKAQLFRLRAEKAKASAPRE